LVRNPYRLSRLHRLRCLRRLLPGRTLALTLLVLSLAVAYESRWLAYEAYYVDLWWLRSSPRYMRIRNDTPYLKGWVEPVMGALRDYGTRGSEKPPTPWPLREWTGWPP
jgi:hypothetical protein